MVETYLLALRYPILHNFRGQLIRLLFLSLGPVRARGNDTNVRTKQGVLLLLILGRGVVTSGLLDGVAHVNYYSILILSHLDGPPRGTCVGTSEIWGLMGRESAEI